VICPSTANASTLTPASGFESGPVTTPVRISVVLPTCARARVDASEERTRANAKQAAMRDSFTAAAGLAE